MKLTTLALATLAACSDTQPAAPAPTHFTGVVAGHVKRPDSSVAFAKVRILPGDAGCTLVPDSVFTFIGTVTDSTGFFLQPVQAPASIPDVCFRLVVNDLFNLDDSVVVAGLHLPMRTPPDTLRVNVILP